MQQFLVLATVLALTSQAATASTLERIRGSGTFRMGYRADAKPYSYQNEQGQPAGYLVDLCLEIARALGPDINPQFVRVAAVQRFEAVRVGHSDIEQDRIGLQLHRQLDGLVTAFCLADYANIRVMEYGRNTTADYWMIVRNQQSDRHEASAFYRIRSRAVV